MHAARLDKFVIPIGGLTYENLTDKINLVQNQNKEIREVLKSQMEIIKKRSYMNSILTMALIKCTARHTTKKKELKMEIRKLMHDFQYDKISTYTPQGGPI
jgi:hypothetical protein